MSSAVTKYKQSYKVDKDIEETPLLPQEKSYGVIKKWNDLLASGRPVTPPTEEEATRIIVTAIKRYSNKKRASLKRKSIERGDEVIR